MQCLQLIIFLAKWKTPSPSPCVLRRKGLFFWPTPYMVLAPKASVARQFLLLAASSWTEELNSVQNKVWNQREKRQSSQTSIKQKAAASKGIPTPLESVLQQVRSPPLPRFSSSAQRVLVRLLPTDFCWITTAEQGQGSDLAARLNLTSWTAQVEADQIGVACLKRKATWIFFLTPPQQTWQCPSAQRDVHIALRSFIGRVLKPKLREVRSIRAISTFFHFLGPV